MPAQQMARPQTPVSQSGIGRDLGGGLRMLALDRGVDLREVASGFLVIDAVGAVGMRGIHGRLLGRRARSGGGGGRSEGGSGGGRGSGRRLL